MQFVQVSSGISEVFLVSYFISLDLNNVAVFPAHRYHHVYSGTQTHRGTYTQYVNV